MLLAWQYRWGTNPNYLARQCDGKGEAPDRHANREVLPLHMRRAYVAQIGTAILYPYYRFDHRRGTVAALGTVLAVVTEQLYDLS